MKKNIILGLDFGLYSLAYALIDTENQKILDAGIILYSNQKKNNEERRKKRLERRQHRYKKNRIKTVRDYLHENNLFPVDPKKLSEVFSILDKTHKKEETTYEARQYLKYIQQDPYHLRYQAVSGHKLEPQELGRIFSHLSQRRGFPKTALHLEKESKIKKGEKGIVGADELEQKIQEYRTLGSYLYTLQQKLPSEQVEMIRRCYTYREMYENEYETICEYQKKSYPILEKETIPSINNSSTSSSIKDLYLNKFEVNVPLKKTKR